MYPIENIPPLLLLQLLSLLNRPCLQTRNDKFGTAAIMGTFLEGSHSGTAYNKSYISEYHRDESANEDSIIHSEYNKQGQCSEHRGYSHLL